MESCVFSLDRGIGECGIEKEKSRETKSKSQNV